MFPWYLIIPRPGYFSTKALVREQPIVIPVANHFALRWVLTVLRRPHRFAWVVVLQVWMTLLYLLSEILDAVSTYLTKTVWSLQNRQSQVIREDMEWLRNSKEGERLIEVCRPKDATE